MTIKESLIWAVSIVLGTVILVVCFLGGLIIAMLSVSNEVLKSWDVALDRLLGEKAAQ